MEINRKFSFKKFATYCNRRNEFIKINGELLETYIPNIVSKLILPNSDYIFNIVKEEKSQTLRDIYIGLGWNDIINDKLSFEIGKVINTTIVQRDFEKIEVNYNNRTMFVRVYNWYEIPFIVSVIYSFFDLIGLIPYHWSYAFYEETNIYNIVNNLLKSNIKLSDNQKEKLEELKNDRVKLKSIENTLYNKSSILVNKMNNIDNYHIINAKYGIAIELFILSKYI